MTGHGLFFVFMNVAFFAFHENTRFVNAGVGQWKLLTTLFNDYEVLERPVKNASDRVLVKMHFYLRQVMDIDEKNQVMLSSIWLNLQWLDARLSWNAADYNNVSKIIVPHTMIWGPDILLWNSAKEMDATFKTSLEVSSDGGINWVPPALFTSTCKIDITWFPFDMQACSLKFSSWTFEPRRLDLELESEQIDISAYQRNGAWDLEDAYGKRNLVAYECCPDADWVDITLTIKLRRRILYYVFNIIVPSIVISIIGLLTFALPCESSEKVTMSVTILLSLAFFMTGVAEKLPATSEAIPFLGMYFGTLMLLCAISLVVTIFVGFIHHHKPDISPVPKWIHNWFICRFAVFFRMLPPNHPIITCNSEFPVESNERKTNPDYLDSVSLRYRRSNDPIQYNASPNIHRNPNDMHSVTLVTSADDRSPLIPLANRPKKLSPTTIEEDQRNMLLSRGFASKGNHQTSSIQPSRRRSKISPTKTTKSTKIPFTEDVSEILDGIRFITGHIAEASRMETISREWRLAAAVVDLFCMYISVALFLVFNFIMAILAPNTPFAWLANLP